MTHCGTAQSQTKGPFITTHNSTQLDVELSSVELRRYKLALMQKNAALNAVPRRSVRNSQTLVQVEFIPLTYLFS